MKYVQQVRGKWIVRITVPPELRDIIGHRELVESGLPSDAKTREKLAHGIINRFFAKIDEGWAMLDARKSAPSVTLSVAAKSHYAYAIANDDQKRAVMPTVAEIDAEKERALDRLAAEQRSTAHTAASVINATTDFELKAGARDFYQNNRTKRLAALRSSFSSGDTRWIEPAVEQYIGANHLDLQRDTPEWRALADALTRSEIEALERTLERDRGDFSGRPSDPLLTAPDPESGPVQTGGGRSGGLTLTEALAAFHEERTAGGSTLAPKTMEEHRNAVRMFNEFMGADVAVGSISKKNVIGYKQALLKTPNRYTMRFPGLTLPQAIKANAKLAEPIPTLAPKTINMKWLSHLSSILQWASENDHADPHISSGGSDRTIFTVSKLTVITRRSRSKG